MYDTHDEEYPSAQFTGLFRGGSRSFGEGLKFAEEVSILPFCILFLKIPHENEVIWTQRGVQLNPANPL